MSKVHYSCHQVLGHGPDGTVAWAVPAIEDTEPVALRRVAAPARAVDWLRELTERLAVVAPATTCPVHDVSATPAAGDSAAPSVRYAAAVVDHTLADCDGRPTSAAAILEVGRTLVAHLRAAHAVGVAHGNVHPGNLGRLDSRLVVLDHGLHAARNAREPWATDESRSADAHAAASTVVTLARGVHDGGDDRPAVLALCAIRPAQVPDLDALSRRLEAIAAISPGEPRAAAARATGDEPSTGVRIDAPVAADAPRRPPPARPVVPGSPPRPPAGARHHRRQRRPPRVEPRRALTGIGAGTAAIIVAAVVAVVALDAGDPGPSAGSGAADRSTPAATADCATSTPPAGWNAVEGRVDLDEDGCPDPVRWDPTRAVLAVDAEPAIRFQFGAPGDVALLGDWDGDGRATPALYRPSTGGTYLFDRWASTDDAPRARPGPVLPAHQFPVVDAGDDGDTIIAAASPPH